MPTQAEENQALRKALRDSKRMLIEQDRLLKRITSSPLTYGVVVNVFETDPETPEIPSVPSPFDLYVSGAVVRGTRNSGFYGEEAVIDGESIMSDGQIHIRFANGNGTWVNQFDHHTGELLDRPALEFVRNDSVVDTTPIIAGFVDVVVDGRLIRMEHPQSEVYPGNVVVVSMKTMQIIDIQQDHPLHGEIALLREFVGDEMFEVSSGGETKIVYPGYFDQSDSRIGDRLVLDSSGIVVINNLGHTDPGYGVEDVNVNWEDIGGLTEAKRILREAVENPIQFENLYKAYNKRPIQGILLVGAPGCGKTLLAKAVATAKAKQAYGSEQGKFLYIKGPELLSRYVGDTELAVRVIFDYAREYWKKHKVSLTIFFDEAESFFQRRGSGISSDVNNSIVPQLLGEMSGFDDHHALVILATNRADMLDPAVTRHGRMDRIIYVGRPTEVAAQDIFQIHMRGVPLNNGYSRADLAKVAVEHLFDPDRVLYNVHLKNGAVQQFTLGHLITGAMVEGLIDQATSIAITRDSTSSPVKPNGVCPEDLLEAARRIYLEQQELNHDWELQEFLYGREQDVQYVTRA